MKRGNLIIVFNSGEGCFRDETGLYTNFNNAPIVNALANEYERVFWSAPLARERTAAHAVKVDERVELVPRPFVASTFKALTHLGEYKASWRSLLEIPGDILVTGNIIAPGEFYKICRRQGRKPTHRLVGDPITLLMSHKRYGFVVDHLALMYAKHWERVVKRGVRETDGAFICVSKELYERMEGCRRYANGGGSGVSEKEFSDRQDVCQGDVIRLLFVSYIRPEKGLEYLLQALNMTHIPQRVELVCIGSRDDKFPEYGKKIDQIVRDEHLNDRVSFLGFQNRNVIFEEMRKADVFILPSLSDGSPRVVTEARSQGLPTIASAVGGIPSMIDDGVNGLLVPPHSPAAIADAVDCVVEDGELRRDLIAGGYKKAREHSVENLIRKIVGVLDEVNGRV